jgi:predicted ATPase with chaperone activity
MHESLAQLSDACLRSTVDATQAKQTGNASVIPPVADSIEEAGIPASIVEHLILKYLHFRGELSGRQLATMLGLQFGLIAEVLAKFKQQYLICVKSALGLGPISSTFALTESGRTLAQDYLNYNQYIGPAPVPLFQYEKVVQLQKLKTNWLTPDQLHHAFRHLVVENDILAQLGPAVSASESFLIYGQPGNGKTALAEALVGLESEPIYIPYALEYQGSIIQIYDPLYHSKIDSEASVLTALSEDPPHDERWFKTRRPFITTGGELTLDMLDLTYNAASKVHDAPFQLKANNGIYLIDDFGRQRATPKEILNRWIIPMERRVDYLNLHFGGKITIPFETFLIFSTNLHPNDLGDEAYLRRIQYKMFVRSPSQSEFLKIFRRVYESLGLASKPGLAESFVQKNYIKPAKPFRRCHPRDLINHAIHIINFERRPKELTEDILDRAFRSCFAQMVDESA